MEVVLRTPGVVQALLQSLVVTGLRRTGCQLREGRPRFLQLFYRLFRFGRHWAGHRKPKQARFLEALLNVFLETKKFVLHEGVVLLGLPIRFQVRTLFIDRDALQIRVVRRFLG